MRQITALHTVRDGQPLTAIQSGLPGPGDWMTLADIEDLARQIRERGIDGRRIAGELAVRHPATPNFHEYATPTFEESCDFSPSALTDHDVYRFAEEKTNG